MFEKFIKWLDAIYKIAFVLAVAAPAILLGLENKTGNILYFVCTGLAVMLLLIVGFVQRPRIRRLENMLPEKWDDDELSKNPEAWETMRDFLDRLLDSDRVPEKTRDDILSSLTQVQTGVYLSSATISNKSLEK